MKYLICFLLSFISIDGIHAQVPLYIVDGVQYTYKPNIPVDVIKSISTLRDADATARDHWNGVSCMWVYEVRIYEEQIRNNTGRRQDGMNLSLPKHFAWLDSKKKPLHMAVWSAKIEQ